MGQFRTTLLVGALVGAGAAMTAPHASAQNQNQRRPRMPKMFSDDDLNVGDTLPDISLYNDKGNPIRLRALRGKYKVIVFGCLT